MVELEHKLEAPLPGSKEKLRLVETAGAYTGTHGVERPWPRKLGISGVR